MYSLRWSFLTVLYWMTFAAVDGERGSFDARPTMDRPQTRPGNKIIRNMLFASKTWLTADQAKKLGDLQTKGDTEGVIRELTDLYRNLRDKSRATLRVQSTCRTILSDEVGQKDVDELISMRAKTASSSELVAKLNSLFRKVKNSDVSAIQPLCVAAYEDSHVLTANDPRRIRRTVAAAA